MAAEYSAIAAQTVAVDENILFDTGCRAVYRVTFNGNIAIATGGTVEPISVALTINGESLGNATATVTPAAVGNFFNVSVTTFIDIPCGCCVTVSVENVSSATAIDVTNANVVLERVA